MADVETRRDDAGALQFERAEYAQAALAGAACAVCGREVHDVYYDVDGATTCERCRHDMALAQADGGGFARFARAALFGLVAAIVSSLLWYGISKVTGYEFGILAIGVGVLVGGAVRAGSRRRGGRRYQALAMWLTYSAIVVTYIPAIVEGVKTATPVASTAATAEPTRGSTATTAKTAAAAASAEQATAPTAGEDDGPLGLPGLLLGLGLLLLIAYAAPFIAVVVDVRAVMGLVILAIALYEAWKMNRRRTAEITGPHRMAGVRGSTVGGA